MKAFDERRFFPAARAAGMLVEAVVLYGGASAPTCAHWVSFVQPSFDPLMGMQSNGFTMEYQNADFPHLRENDSVIIGTALAGSSSGPDAVMYRVREEPRTDGESASGFFRKVTLTKMKA